MKCLKFLRMAPLALGLTVLISSCSTRDLYEPDPEIPEQPEEPMKPSEDINWATNTTTVLNVDVNDEYNGQYYYTVEVFVGNPIVDANAKMIAGSGQKTNSKVPYSREIVVPKGTETIYVLITDPFKRRWVQSVDMQEGTITLDTATGTVSTKSEALGANALRSDNIERPEYPDVDFSFDRSSLQKLSGTASQLKRNTNYIIEKGNTLSSTLTFAGDGNINLYVEGTLEISGNVVLQNNTNIFVLNGGVVKIKPGGRTEFDMKQESFIAIQEGGRFGEESKGTIIIKQITNGAKIVNNGDFYLSQVTTNSKGSLYNKGNMTSSGKVTLDTESEFINQGKFSAAEMEMKSKSSFYNEGIAEISGKFAPKGGKTDVLVVNTNTLIAGEIDAANGVIENHCLIQTPKMIVGASGVVYLMSGSYIDSETLRFHNSNVTVNMDALSIWESQTFSCENNAVLNGSPDSDYALFKTKEFKGLGWNGFYINKKLQIEATSYSGKWKADSSVQIFEGSGTSTVVIPADECNNNTGNKNVPEGPGDDDDTYEDGETLPYTYLFEDNWPAKGDYDMNDLVMSVELRNTVKGTKTEKVQVKATLYAAGGTIVLAAGYQLDGIRASMVSGAEEGQEYAVLQLFDDAHYTLGATEHVQINTYRIDYTPQVIEQDIVFTTPIDGVVNANNFNLFLVLGGDFGQEKRKEVHLPGFKGTKKASTSEFSTEDYIDIETGWMWGLAIPQTVFGTYPKEGIRIEEAYTGFDAWVTGNDAPDWYNYPVDGNVIIFEEPSEEEI